MAIVDLKQGTPEWLAWRQNGIGASEVFTLAAFASELGFKEPSPLPITERPSWLTTPQQLLQRKLGMAPEIASNPDMQRGNRLEPVLRTAANKQWEAEFKPVCIEVAAQSPLRASLDGLAGTRKSALILEIKAPRRRMTQPPLYYVTQVAYQRAVAAKALNLKSIRSGLVAGYENDEGEHKADGISFDVFPIKAHAEYELWLTRLVEFFWAEYVKAGQVPPAVTGDVKVRSDAPFVAAAQKYAASVAALDAAKEQSDIARKLLLDLVGPFSGSVAGGGIRMVSVTRQGAVDYKKAIDTLSPGADLEPFRKEGTSSVTITMDKPEKSSKPKVSPIRKTA